MDTMLLLYASEAEKIFVLGLLMIVILGVPVVTIIVHLRNKLNRQEAILLRKRKEGKVVSEDVARRLNNIKRSAVTLPLIAVMVALSGMATCHTINEIERSTYRNAQSHWVSGNGAKDGMCAAVGGQTVCHLGEGGFKLGLLMFFAAAVLIAVPMVRQKGLNKHMRVETIVEKSIAKNSATDPSS